MRFIKPEPKKLDFDMHYLPAAAVEPSSRMVWVTRNLIFELEADPSATWTSPTGRECQGWKEVSRRAAYSEH